MINAPAGWHIERAADGWVLAPPGGPARGVVLYAERRRPIRRAIDLVRAARVPPGFVETALGAPRRLTTHEGEHAALCTRSGTLDGRPAELIYGYVFLDDYYASLEAIVFEDVPALTAAIEDLVVRDAHLLGRQRRRRFVYQPPPGWQGAGDVFEARWYPVDYPANPARAFVNPALPNTPGLAAAILDNLVASGLTHEAAPEHFMTAHALAATYYAMRARDVPAHVYFLSDNDFVYTVRVDLVDDVARRLIHSIEPIPRGGGTRGEAFPFWSD